MKKFAVMFLIITLPLLVACSSGGGGGLDDGLNPYGFVVTAFTTATAGTNPLPSNNVRAVIRPLPTGNAFIGTDTGIYSFDPNVSPPQFTQVTGGDIAAGSTIVVNKLITDGTAGNFYVCADSGLYLYDATAKTFTRDTNIGALKVLTFTRQSDTVFWVGLEDLVTANSIMKVDSAAVAPATVATTYGTAQGNTASSVACIYVDANIVMACGAGDTGKGGLFRYDPSGAQFTRQPVTVGLENGASLFFVVGTSWYAGGKDSGLVVSTDSGISWTKTSLAATASPVDFQTEIFNYTGYKRYWLATEEGAYLSYDLANFTLYNAASGMAGNVSNQIYAGSPVWVANNGGGLSRLAFDGN